MDITTVYLILFFICLLFSAYFSSAETAFMSLQRVRLAHLVATKARGATRVSKLLERPERLLAAILFGNNLVNTAAASLGAALAIIYIQNDRWALLVATVAVTAVLLVFGEVTPKTFSARHPERLAFLYIRPTEFFVRLFYPLAVLLSSLGTALSGRPRIPTLHMGEDEIRSILTLGVAQGTVEKTEAEMVEKVFRFGDKLVRDVMVPRATIVWVEKGTTLDQFLAIYAENPHSRFPVYEENRDNVVGILSAKEVLLAQARGEVHEDFVVTSLARPALFVPATKLVGELFSEMQAQTQPVAVVVDEFGGTAGLVTVELLVEEIVGDLRDELARLEPSVETIDEKTVLLPGGMRIDEANDELHLNLPAGEYETVAGFVLNRMGRIPREGDHFRFDHLRLVVAEMKGLKVNKVLVARL